MGGLGDFLLKAAEWIWDFWPLRIVNDWEQGVRLLGGHATKLLTSTNARRPFSGIHAFIPGFGEILVEEANVETPETELQDFLSADGTAWCAAFAVTFRIKDLRALYLKVHDHQETIISEAKAAIAAAGRTLTDDEMGEKLETVALEEAKKQTWGWGLELMRIRPTTLTKVQALRIVGDAPSVSGD